MGGAAPGGGGERGRTHTVNPGQRRRRMLRLAEVPAEAMSDMDAITAVDQRVYRGAVLRLLCDLRALEAATGVNVLCLDALKRLQNRTAHIEGLWSRG